MVNIIASHVVKPAKPMRTQVMYLSELDQIYHVTHSTTVHFYKPENPDLVKDAAKVLKDSLSEALVTFFPLAGRLYQKGGGRLELHCNSLGALLVEAESELLLEDLGDLSPSPQIRSLIPPADLNNSPIHEIPLLLVQFTKFACGCVSLGLALSHIIADGQSGFHFISEWGKIARGEKSDDLPFLDRTIFQQYYQEDHNNSSPRPKLLQFKDFHPLPFLKGQSSSLEESRKPITSPVLKLSKEQIEQIKNKANYQDLIHESTTTVTSTDQVQQQPHNKFSRFVAVSAHIWKCLSKARVQCPDQETVLYVTVNIRNRLKQPPLPPRYFGNAIVNVPARAIAGDIQSRPLSYASSKIQEAIESVNDEYARSFLACIKNIPDVSSIRRSHTVGCPQGSFYGNPNLHVTSWAGLGLYQTNFGWGNEIFMTPGSIGYYDGRYILIPSHDGDGSFMIAMRLQLEHIDAFNKYFYGDII